MLFVFIFGPYVFGLELYTIVHEGCKINTGLIVNVDNDSVFQLNMDGDLVQFPRKGIEHILVFNTLENPFYRFNHDGGLNDFAREVHVLADEETSFVGWPIRFIEDLIVFFDIEGKTHLVNIEAIQRFSIPDTNDFGEKKITGHKKYTFGLGKNLPECGKDHEESKNLVQPTRMISDIIKVSKFLSVYQKGFVKLGRLQKRTAFYARPYLFEKKTTVGLVYTNENLQEELPQMLPLSFQWPSGRNYGPQGFLKVGMAVNEMLPNVEPVFGLRFEGKYHFLSIAFAGNPLAFNYGSDLMIKNKEWFKDFFSRRESGDVLLLPQYNQIALTGFEQGPYSFSAGYYYPMFGIQGNTFRTTYSDCQSSVHDRFKEHKVFTG